MQHQAISTDLVLIRHAQSGFNEATQTYVRTHELIYDWAHLSADQRFLKEIKYSINYVDCDITEKGHQQCSKAKQIVKDYHPDVILVSPLLRTLRTCTQIFKNQKCPWIAQPLLTEAIRSSSDVNGSLQERKKMFPNVDFSKVEQLGDLWCLNVESEQNKAAYLKHLNQKTPLTSRQSMLTYMLQTYIYETATHLRHTRIPLVKELLKEYRKKYNKIAVVSHYNIIRFTIATEFNNRDEPEHSVIENCEVIQRNITDLPK